MRYLRLSDEDAAVVQSWKRRPIDKLGETSSEDTAQLLATLLIALRHAEFSDDVERAARQGVMKLRQLRVVPGSGDGLRQITLVVDDNGKEVSVAIAPPPSPGLVVGFLRELADALEKNRSEG